MKRTRLLVLAPLAIVAIGNLSQAHTIADKQSWGSGFGTQFHAGSAGIHACSWNNASAICYFPNDKVLRVSEHRG